MNMQTANGQPLVINCDENGSVIAAHEAVRLDLRSGYNEDWLQALLFKEPALLSVGLVDQRVQKELIPLAMEVGLPSGICDALFVSRDGYIAVVETKLWRNPQSRREVVAQTLDYATHIRRWDYPTLESLWRERNPEAGTSVWQHVEPAETEAEWTDLVSRNLKAGRMTLVVAGDGIREEAWDLAETVSGHPDFEFRLGLVEIRLYRTPSGTVIAVPHVQTRTKEVTRAIVRIEGEHRLPEGIRVQVETTPDKPRDAGGSGRTTPKPEDLPLEEFWDYVASESGARAEEVRSCVKRLLADLDDEEFGMRMKGRSPIFVASIGDAEAQLGRLYSNGYFVCYVTKGTARDIARDGTEADHMLRRCEELREKLGINESIGVDIGLRLSPRNYDRILAWLRGSKTILEDTTLEGSEAHGQGT